MLIFVTLLLQVTSIICQEYFDFQLYHNLTEDNTQKKSFVVNKYATQGFGRILTWNIKKLGACLRQDNVQQLKDTVCTVLQSANIIALQEAENLDLSCLPCNAVLKDDYEWPGPGSSEEFKVLVKTRHQRSFSIKKVGKCSTTTKENGSKRQLSGSERNIYLEVMRQIKLDAQDVALKKSEINNKDDKKDLNETINTRFTDVGMNSTTNSSSVLFNSTSDSVDDRGLKRFQQKNETEDTTMDKSVTLSRFLLQSERNLTVDQDNSTNVQNYTDRQIERFLGVNTDTGDDVEELKERLYKSRARLNSTRLPENKIERFKVIGNQLNDIEKEIDEISGADKDILIASKTGNQNFTVNVTSAIQNITESATLYNNTSILDESNLLDTKKRDENNSTSNKLNDLSDLDSKINEMKNESNPSELMNPLMEIPHTASDLDNMRNSSNLSLLSSFIRTSSEPNTDRFKNISDSSTVNVPAFPVLSPLIDTLKSSNELKGSRKSNVEGSEADKRNKDSSEKSVISTRNKKKVVLLKNVFKYGGHLVLKRTIKADRDRRDQLQTRSKDMNAIKRDQTQVGQENLVEDVHYTVMVITSDLNSGEPFLLVNLRLPKEKVYQRRCVGDIVVDISRVIAEEEKKMKILIMGDFHFDRLTGYDSNGWLYKMLNNLHLNDENYHSAITYNEKDPITTVYGRRFDNIITNINIQGNMKTIGPDFPLVPDAVILPFTLQRLYNNYMTALYTSEGDDADSIYECIKAFQIAGKAELENNICKDTWVPSSYISDHLPLQITAKFKVPQRVAPVELNLASWNIQGSSFKERLLDSAVKKAFIKAIKQYHVAIFHEFPTHDKILEDEEIGKDDIVRLTQGDLSTEFGIFVNQYAKDGETDMFALRKKFHTPTPNDEPDKRSHIDIISTVGLFIPKLVVDTLKIRPCLYTVKTSEAEIPTVEDFSSILDAIYKDVQARDCDFKVLLASLNLDENFNLEKEIYKKYKFLNMRCTLPNKDNKYSYNIPRSRDLADYIILIGGHEDVTFSDCTIGLPGDERKRGIEKLNDFEELTTHYPLSLVIKKSDV